MLWTQGWKQPRKLAGATTTNGIAIVELESTRLHHSVEFLRARRTGKPPGNRDQAPSGPGPACVRCHTKEPDNSTVMFFRSRATCSHRRSVLPEPGRIPRPNKEPNPIMPSHSFPSLRRRTKREVFGFALATAGIVAV